MCQPASICCSLFVFKLYHKTCEQFYRNFGLYEKSPNSFLPGLPRSIINQFRFHNFLCLCLASVHLPHPFHLVFGFQLFGHAVALHQLRHDQLHAISCRFVNLGAILSYVHPAIWPGLLFIPLRAWKILFELASVLISAILQTRYKTYIRSYGAIR